MREILRIEKNSPPPVRLPATPKLAGYAVAAVHLRPDGSKYLTWLNDAEIRQFEINVAERKWAERRRASARNLI